MREPSAWSSGMEAVKVVSVRMGASSLTAWTTTEIRACQAKKWGPLYCEVRYGVVSYDSVCCVTSCRMDHLIRKAISLTCEVSVAVMPPLTISIALKP